jgi:hypothetical protein
MTPFSRRALLALAGASPAAAVALIDDQAGGAALPPGTTVNTREQLARIDAAPGEVRWLDEGARNGRFVWRAGDHRQAIGADPLQGLSVAHHRRPPSDGAWLRIWDGVHGRAEWFGAQADHADVDCTAAIQAALDLCPTVLLCAGIYHTRARLLIVRNSTRLIGAGIAQTDQGQNGRATVIACASADATILQIGVDDSRQPPRLVEGVQLADFTVKRSVDPLTPPKGVAGAIGIALRWCVNCHITRIFSIESARGWFFYGTVENYVTYCSALRGRRGTNPANDVFVGFHLDYTAPLAANGGNASLYIDHCRAFGGYGAGRPALTYSAGLRTDGGWVDLYIHAFETGAIQFGIDGYGDAHDGGTSYRTEDLIITNCVLDPGEVACIRLQSADASSAVQISNCYLATIPAGTCLILRDIGGAITVTGNQFITGAPGATGMSAANINNLRAEGNIYTRLRQPVWLQSITGLSLRDTINGIDGANAYPAVTMIDCTRGMVECTVSGRSGSYATGVDLRGSGNSLIEVRCTNLERATFTPGPAKLIADGAPVRGAGPFGRDCLAQGIMA